MANYRKKVRDGLVAVLSDATTGFNASIDAIAASYDIVPFELEFGADSKNVVYGYLDEAESNVSRIFEFPGAIIYTTEAVREGKVKFSAFSGFVAGVIVLWLRLRALDDAETTANQPDDSNDYEKWPDACEDAMHEALYAGRSIFQTNGFNMTEYRADRDPVVSTGDGHMQRITFTLGFEVHL